MNLIRREVRCGCCGEMTEQILSGAGSAGEGNLPPDLDTRPNGSIRATISFWMQRCPHCGYCAADIAVIHEQAIDLIATVEYQRWLVDARFPEKARPFLCYARILAHVGQPADAGWSSLHAAWVCDDADASDAAVSARALALDYWRDAKKSGHDFGEPELEPALVIDLLRRMGRFHDALINCTQALDLDDEQEPLPSLIEHLLRFEKTLIQKHDTGSYRLNDLPAFHA